MSGKYDDILHLPHPVSRRHARMSVGDRAAQFSPFAALTGYEEAIEETGRLTQSRREISETRRGELDRVLQEVLNMLENRPMIRVLRFVEDYSKEGGAYVSGTHRIVKADLYRRELICADGLHLPLEDLWEMELLTDHP